MLAGLPSSSPAPPPLMSSPFGGALNESLWFWRTWAGDTLAFPFSPLPSQALVTFCPAPESLPRSLEIKETNYRNMHSMPPSTPHPSDREDVQAMGYLGSFLPSDIPRTGSGYSGHAPARSSFPGHPLPFFSMTGISLCLMSLYHP